MSSDKLDTAILKEIEASSVRIAREAGHILLEHFNTALEISHKDNKKTDPVTMVDHLSEEYLKKAIKEKFPEHNILSEESGISTKNDNSPFTWVLDPLDGTVNYVNNLPFFAVSIGVLWKNQPVVGSIYVPVSHKATEGVYHGYLDNGAFFNGERITVSTETPGKPLIDIPPRFGSRYHVHRKSRKELHEARNLGSIACELALTASGVFQFALFNSPKLWDVASGIVLIKEAGGVVFSYGKKSKNWKPFDKFEVEDDGNNTSLEILKGWSNPLLAGVPHTANNLAKAIRIRRKPLSIINKIIHRRSKKRLHEPVNQLGPVQARSEGNDGISGI